MNSTTMKERIPLITWEYEFPGITFRHFNGPTDFPGMVEVIRDCMDTDGIQRVITVEDMQTFFDHLNNCDPYQDVLLVQREDKLIAYVRMEWQEQTDGKRIYRWILNLIPEDRGNGLETRLVQYAEAHLRKIASTHPSGTEKHFEIGIDEKETQKKLLLEDAGYNPIRYFFEMARDLNEPFPESALRQGLEIRPSQPDQYRRIWSAMEEAFRDHWGHREYTEEDYQGWVKSRWFQPHLWKVAWDGDEVVGTVLSFIDDVENETFNRKRGYTEDICVRRPWRRQGVARALLVQSMKELKSRGMTEAALGVDTENLSGALRLYLGVGYHREQCHIVYRKPIEP